MMADSREIQWTIQKARNILAEVLEFNKVEMTYSWFSHDVTKIRTTKLLIFLRLYLNDA